MRKDERGEQTFIIDTQNAWHFYFQEYQFDCVVTSQQRQDILDEIMRLFTTWILEGRKYSLSFEYDPPWDQSGETLSNDLSNDEKIELLSGTLESWMKEFTGNWTPTFCSGMGKYHRTYENAVREYIEDTLGEIFRAQFSADLSEDVHYAIAESDELAEAQWEMADVIFEQAQQISASEAYRQFELDIQKQHILLEARQIINAEYRNQARLFFDKYIKSQLPAQDAPSFQIDKPLWKKFKIADKLQDALAHADKEECKAIQAVGLKILGTSNSVQREIDEIVEKFFKHYKTAETAEELT